jgi:Pyruvate/2-oxoacid:ferredoxin oxidoreductase delta subunit
MLPGTAPNSVTGAIIEHCPEHLPEFEIALNTRMRKSEQYRTEWQHLNFERAIACRWCYAFRPRSAKLSEQSAPIVELVFCGLGDGLGYG